MSALRTGADSAEISDDFLAQLKQELVCRRIARGMKLLESRPELLTVANFWRGRCLRMQGEYDQALTFAVKGREIASELGHNCMAAVMRVLESWLFFQKGDAKRATDILHEAEAVLSATDDYLT